MFHWRRRLRTRAYGAADDDRDDVDKADNFVIEAPTQLVGEDLTLRKFIETCVSENDRGMAQFDPRLPRPTLLPKVMRMVLRAMPYRDLG